MAQIKATVTERTITLTDTPELFSGAKNTDSVAFTLDDEWSSYTKKAIFIREKGNKLYEAAMSGNSVIIPEAALMYPGRLQFGLVGTSGNNRLTSEMARVIVRQGARTADELVDVPSDNDLVYTQIMAKFNEVNAKTDDLSEWKASVLAGNEPIGVGDE